MKKMFGANAMPGYELCVGCEIEVPETKDGGGVEEGPEHLTAKDEVCSEEEPERKSAIDGNVR